MVRNADPLYHVVGLVDVAGVQAGKTAEDLLQPEEGSIAGNIISNLFKFAPSILFSTWRLYTVVPGVFFVSTVFLSLTNERLALYAKVFPVLIRKSSV